MNMRTKYGSLADRILSGLHIRHRRLCAVENWGQLAAIITAQMRRAMMTTGKTDSKSAELLLTLMNRSAEPEPELALAYLVGADEATADEALNYWEALHRRGAVTETEALELARDAGL